jgi:hypothetical protein
MRKLLLFVLALAVTALLYKKYLDGQAGPKPGERSQAKQRLDVMREKAKQIERDDQQRLDDVLRKTEGK